MKRIPRWPAAALLLAGAALAGEPPADHAIGAGLSMAFPATLEVSDFAMPEGATNLRGYGKQMKLGITGIPTGKPRVEQGFLDKTLGESAANQFRLPAADMPALEHFSGDKYLGAYTAACSADPKKKFQVFADAAFTCMTIAIISADGMVFIASLGSESITGAGYQGVLAAITSAH